jgi:protein required for attachment to host cells
MNVKPGCVVVADEARARIFTAAGRALTEQPALANPERRVPDHELFSESRPGTQRGGPGAPAHTLEDHRARHVEEMERRFARHIAHDVEGLAAARGAEFVVLVAAPRMLGHLRRAFAAARHRGVDVRELPRNLHELTTDALAERLATEGLLRPVLVDAPR